MHHRGDLISSNELAKARHPKANAARQAVAKEAQRIAETFGINPQEALASVVKRRKWEQRNNRAMLQRNTRYGLPERQND